MCVETDAIRSQACACGDKRTCCTQVPEALAHLHHHLLQSVLLLAFDNDAGASERLLKARHNFVLQSEERDAVVAQHAQLLRNVAQP